MGHLRPGNQSHLTEEMTNRELKLDMEIILYKGAVPQLTDVMGGHVLAAAPAAAALLHSLRAAGLQGRSR